MEAKKTKVDYEIKYITIPVPKGLAMLTTVMAYEQNEMPGINVNTIGYGTKELKDLENKKVDMQKE